MKQYLRIYYLVLSATVLLPALFVFVADPFQVFHNHVLHPPKFHGNQRYQKAGLIRSLLTPGSPYDAVVLGTSLSENFDPAVLSAELGWTALDLTASGAYPTEKKIVVEAALRTGRVKHVLWDIDAGYATDRMGETSSEAVFPYYLYSGSRAKAWKYLFNWSNVEIAKDLITGKEPWSDSPHRMNCWQMQSFHHGDFLAWTQAENLDRLAENILEAQKKPKATIHPEAIVKGLEKYVLSVTRQFPETEFVLFLPPYSTYYYALHLPQLKNHLALRRALVKMLVPEKNIRLFSFDNQFELTDNLFNYRDMNHYSESVSDLIVRSVAKNENRLGLPGWQAKLKAFGERVERYQIRPPLAPSRNTVFRPENRVRRGRWSVYFDNDTRVLGLTGKCRGSHQAVVHLKRSPRAASASCFESYALQTNPFLTDPQTRDCYQAVYLPKCYELHSVEGAPFPRKGDVALGRILSREAVGACPRLLAGDKRWVLEK